MPMENARKRARKLVKLPGGDTCYIPVITEIDFIDPVGDPSAQAVKWAPGQEFDYSVDNTAKSGRTVHVDQVVAIAVDRDGNPGDPPTELSGASLAVERIDTWPVLDVVERGQEFDFVLDNKTGAGSTDPNNLTLPHFSTHQKTHIYRYYQDPMNPNDSGIWIDSELIDQLDVVDAVNRGQESQFTLLNQTNDQFRGGDLSGQADPNDPDITIGDGSGEGTFDNPVRTDPFQNIVNWSGHQRIALAQWNFIGNYSSVSPCELAFTLIGHESISGPAGFVVDGAPSVPPVNIAGTWGSNPWIPDVFIYGGTAKVFSGTTSVTGSVDLFAAPVSGGTIVQTGDMSTANISGVTGDLSGLPWNLIAVSIVFFPVFRSTQGPTFSVEFSPKITVNAEFREP